MEIITFLFIIILIIVFLQLSSQKRLLENKFDDLQNSLNNIYFHLANLEKALEERKQSPVVSKDATPIEIQPIIAAQKPEVVVPPPVEELPVVTEKVETPEPVATAELLEEIAEIGQTPEPSYVAEPEPVSFWEKYPDLERFIGENLINKIGIVILVLGMGFFLKYAIDQNWINEIGRTCIGVVTGGVLIGLGHKMRNLYRSFSSVLIGGGIAILYFAITIAFQQYHLLGQELAFLIMILITVSTVVLSVLYDRIELAIFAILGGFGAPFMVSTGEGNYIVLFTYLLILNSGMLVLAFYKKWNLVNQICFVLTTILFGGWLYTTLLYPETYKPKPYWGALIYATLFYLVFFLMNIANNVKENVRFNVFEILQILSNTAFYFTWGMLILNPVENGMYRGAFTLFVAVVNFVFSFVLFKNTRIDKNLLYLLIGLVLTFVSLAAPIQLEGNHITLFWALECVLVLWLAHKSGIRFLNEVSVLLIGLMLISLVMDWNNLYINISALPGENLFPVFNKGFITSVVAVLGIAGYSYLLRRNYDPEETIFGVAVKDHRNSLPVIIILLTYAGIFLELDYQLKIHFPTTRVLIIGCFNYLYVIGLIFLVREKKAFTQLLVLTLAILLIISYLPLYNKETIAIRNAYLIQKDVALGSFILHYLLSALFLVTFYFIYKFFKTQLQNLQLKTGFQWFAILFILGLLSAELDHLVVFNQFDGKKTIEAILTTNHKAGFAILWGVFSFLLIYLGMRWKSKTIRIASLSLFGTTLLKLFIFDISGISEGGKIAAFISLGVLLLIMSFMYQKLKAILLADETNQEASEHEN